jgi:hypothetical protein
MLETPHVFIGAAIATAIPNPFIAVPLAFASHFVLEMVPHWNPHLNSETKKFGQPTRRSTFITTVDATIALVSGSFIAYQAFPDMSLVVTILACCFAAVLPDVMEGPYFFLHMKNAFIEKWISFQKSLQNDTGPVLGMLTQAVAIVAAVLSIKS